MIFLRNKTKRDKKNRSLLLILIISFISLNLALLLILGILGAIFGFYTNQNIIFSQQQLISQNAANRVTSFIQEKFSAMETSARLMDPTFISRKEQDRILNHLLGPIPSFRQLVLLDLKKQKIAGSSRLTQERLKELNSRFGKDLFNQTSQGKKYISSVYVDIVSNEPIIIMAVPVKNAFGDSRGVLIAEVNLKFMWDLVEGMKVGRTGLAYVVDRQGRLIAFNDISRVLKGENVGNLKVVDEFIKNSAPKVEAKAILFKGINGAMVVGTYVSLGMPDWAVVTELPVSEAYKAIINNILFIIFFSILLIVLAGWVSIYLARRVSEPIVKLMETAVRIAGGEMELQAEVGGPAEISGLAKAFNSMTTQLREIIDKLEQRSRYLQETVQKYVEYMEEVGKGKLESRLKLEKQKGGENDLLLILGYQLNDTTANLHRMIAQIQDATVKIKKHEEKLQVYADKLKKSNDELEQFAYVASHDLQEPLRKINTFGNRLKEKYYSSLDDQGRDYLERMQNASTRMQTLINDLLAYSRVTTKSNPFVCVDLTQIVQEVLSDLEIQIEKTSGRVEVDCLPSIEADPTQIRQLFQNLIGNALKFHKENEPPIIKIYASILNVKLKKCELIVEDNGIGIEEKNFTTIFGVFQRLHSRNKYEGSGVGLAICKKIVERHNGSIKVESKLGEGTKFIINLSIKQIN